MESAWSGRSRVSLALILLCVCTFGNTRMLHRAVCKCLRSPESDSERFTARFDSARSLLLSGSATGSAPEPVGYLLDEEHLSREPVHPDARLFLTQYAMSPCVVERTTCRRLVIFDSDEPGRLPEVAVRENWVLVADLGNGVRLFQTPAEQ